MYVCAGPVIQSCLTPCSPMDYSPPSSCFLGILQARILVWVAISFSRGSSQPRETEPAFLVPPALVGRFFTTVSPRKPSIYVCECYVLSHVRLFATPWTIAHKAPMSMGFSRQEYWRGLPFPSPGIYIMEYYSVEKRNKMLMCAKRWVVDGPSRLCLARYIYKYCMILFI